jgi:hypothetical protein
MELEPQSHSLENNFSSGSGFLQNKEVQAAPVKHWVSLKLSSTM